MAVSALVVLATLGGFLDGRINLAQPEPSR
jgi:hypothetical protein